MRGHGTWAGWLAAATLCACGAPAPAARPARAVEPPAVDRFGYRLEHGCPLTYAFVLTEKSDQSYGQEREYRGRFVLRLGGGQVERGEAVQLVLDELRSRNHYGGRRMAPDGRAPGIVITLSLDGGVWQNERDAHYPWEQLGSALGLGALFPALPDAAEAGAKTSWAVPAEPEGWQGHVDVVDVSEDRADEGARPLRAVDLEARWRVARVDHTAESALISLRLSGSQVDEELMERLLKQYALTKGEARGRYLVSESGRLLRASVEDARQLEWHYENNDRTSTTQTQLEATLVDACDGPTLPPPEARADTPEEAAIARAGELLEALEEQDHERTLGLIDEAVIARHGGAAVSLLQNLAAVHAPSALGDPRYNVQYVRSDAGDVVLRLQGSGRNPRQPDSWETFESTWTIAFRRGKPFIRSIAVARHGQPVFEVSLERLFASP